MFLRKIALATSLIVAGLLTTVTVASAETIRFAATDINGLEELQRQYGPFIDTLSKAMGVDIEFYPVNNRTVAAEAMRGKQLDFVLTGPSEYVVYQSRVKLTPVVALSRPDYFSVLVVRRDSGINTVADLKGKRIAFNDIASTSGHIGPSLVLAAAGIDPVKDIQGLNLDSALGYEGLKRGDVEAWATSQTSYMRMRDADEDVQVGDFKVVGRGPDLPDDVIVAAGHVDPAMVERFRAAFADPETAKALREALSFSEEGHDRYNLSSFITDVKDSEYDYMRQGYIAIGQPQFAKPAAE